MRLDYVDIFYSHRFDPDTPLEETMGALDTAVRQGKARYVGISSYSPRRTEEAALILRELGTPLLIHQPSYSLINRWIEQELLDVLDREGVGTIVFSPLAQGLLTNRYLDGVPEDSRVRIGNYFGEEMLSQENLARVRALNDIAQRRGQSLAQMAIAWVLRDPRDHLGAAGRLERRAARAERGRARAPRLRPGRARGDRPLRRRGRDQHLGGVEHRVARFGAALTDTRVDRRRPWWGRDDLAVVVDVRLRRRVVDHAR